MQSHPPSSSFNEIAWGNFDPYLSSHFPFHFQVLITSHYLVVINIEYGAFRKLKFDWESRLLWSKVAVSKFVSRRRLIYAEFYKSCSEDWINSRQKTITKGYQWPPGIYVYLGLFLWQEAETLTIGTVVNSAEGVRESL